MKKTLIFLLTAAMILPCFVATANAERLAPSARAAVLMSSDGRILYGKSEHSRLPMASTTKIMTAVVVIERTDPDELVTVPRETVGTEGSSIYLTEGEKLTVRDLLYALMLSSANDAAVALAVHTAGSVKNFAALMNDKADDLGLENTHFVNPHGLDADGHYTSALDLARLTAYAFTLPLFGEISGTKIYSPTGSSSQKVFVNHNRLLSSYDGCIGGKTGYTKKTGRCLVSVAQKNGLTLIAVTLSDPDDWRDHTALLDFGFENYRSVTLCRKGDVIRLVPVSGGIAPVPVSATDDVAVTVRVSLDLSSIKKVVEGDRFYWSYPPTNSYAGKLIFIIDTDLSVSVALTT